MLVPPEVPNVGVSRVAGSMQCTKCIQHSVWGHFWNVLPSKYPAQLNYLCFLKMQLFQLGTPPSVHTSSLYPFSSIPPTFVLFSDSLLDPSHTLSTSSVPSSPPQHCHPRPSQTPPPLLLGFHLPVRPGLPHPCSHTSSGQPSPAQGAGPHCPFSSLTCCSPRKLPTLRTSTSPASSIPLSVTKGPVKGMTDKWEEMLAASTTSPQASDCRTSAGPGRDTRRQLCVGARRSGEMGRGTPRTR